MEQVTLKKEHLDKLGQILGELPYKWAQPILTVLQEASKNEKEDEKQE